MSLDKTKFQYANVVIFALICFFFFVVAVTVVYTSWYLVNKTEDLLQRVGELEKKENFDDKVESFILSLDKKMVLNYLHSD